ncbi:MAG: MFS transporter [Alphaproteobacteria bacterium]|jgi:putative MFS transporter|nr:MFS transporter [Alphaproteobacteria bacterium]
MSGDGAPARFAWLPPGLRPPVAMTWRQERVFLLVGAAALFAGYDLNIYGLAIPQIQASLHIPEDQVGLTVSYFRLAALVALLLCASADLIGRRRLLLVTVLGQALATLATAFADNYAQFVWAQFCTRVFGYAEEMLCFVVIAEEVAAAARGWGSGALSGMYYTGAGLASLIFAAVNLLPYGWRALYVIGAIPLFLVAYLRRRLPETERFVAREDLDKTRSRFAVAIALLRDLARQYPGRLAAILIAVGAFGFGASSASVLSAKYLQTAHGFTPGQITLLFIPGGLIGLALTILTGRLSDRLGRKPVTLAVVAFAGAAFALFYSGVGGPALALLWILSFFGFFAGDALLAGFALEIVPTQYRATVSGLRYLVEILMGAVALALEGLLYNHFQDHGPAIQLLLAALPLTLVAIFFLPEPAGRKLEEMTA